MKTPEKRHPDPISSHEAGTLPGLFRQRVDKTPDAVAYRQHDPATGSWNQYTWGEAAALAGRWQHSLAQEKLAPGDRVAVLLRNCLEWVCFDLASLNLGLVVVPLYTSDNPENIAYILADSGTKLLLVENVALWEQLAPLQPQFPALLRVLCLTSQEKSTSPPPSPLEREGTQHSQLFRFVNKWLAPDPAGFPATGLDPHALATIVYTSGTTGRPKGVMLSHHNILWDAEAALQSFAVYSDDIFLSFLPFSHMFERTTGYYLPIMSGSCVAYARSIQELGEDLAFIRPTVLIAVPRIFERFYGKIRDQLQDKGKLAELLFRLAVDIGWRRFEASQGRGKISLIHTMMWPLLRRLVADKILNRLGGRLRIAVSGGAPLFESVSRCFIGLGLQLIQGYGLTEASPIVCGNRLENNIPGSVGEPLPGVSIRIGENDELLVKSPGVMLGYWNRPEETRKAIDEEGWLHTGDQAQISNNHVYILGRIKEILVTSTGEKVSPADMEMAICQDPLFDMAMVVGEGKSFLAALLVLNPAAWQDLAAAHLLSPTDPASLRSSLVTDIVLEKIRQSLRSFPGHAKIPSVHIMLEPWTIENGLITPTLKLKRPAIEKRFSDEIRQLYAKHDFHGLSLNQV